MPHGYTEDLLVEQPPIGLIFLGVAVGVARVHGLACAGLLFPSRGGGGPDFRGLLGHARGLRVRPFKGQLPCRLNAKMQRKLQHSDFRLGSLRCLSFKVEL